MQNLLMIVKQIEQKLNLKFNQEKGEFYREGLYLRFKACSQGVPVFLLLEDVKCNKTKAYFSVGEYRRDRQMFSKTIYFNRYKSDKAIMQDLFSRLEMENTSEKIDLISQERKSVEEKRDIEAAKLAIFKGMIPNLFVHSNGIDGSICSSGVPATRVTFSLDHSKRDITIRCNDDEFAMRVCAAAVKIHKEMFGE